MVSYENSKGKKINLTLTEKSILKLKEANFHAYEWNYTAVEKTYGKKIKKFGMEEKKIEVEIAFIGTRQEKISALNEFFETTEIDVLTNQPGKLYVNDYYLECFITASSTSPAESYFGVSKSVKITAPHPLWMKESLFHYGIQTNTADVYLDYDHDYPHDYTSSVLLQEIENVSLNGLDFEIKIYGPCVDPSVHIGGHTYSVEGTIEEQETLVINSRSKELYKVKADGTQENFYRNRNRDYYIYEKIKQGEKNVLWNGSFAFDIKTYEERSEPKWI